MAQHPTPAPTPSARNVARQATIAPALPASPAAMLAVQRQADLLASVRDIASLNPLAGVVSGPGNQGSANAAHLLGHAGTPATFLGCPRVLGAAGSWGMQP